MFFYVHIFRCVSYQFMFLFTTAVHYILRDVNFVIKYTQVVSLVCTTVRYCSVVYVLME